MRQRVKLQRWYQWKINEEGKMWLGQEHIHESDAISSKTIKEEENQI